MASMDAAQARMAELGASGDALGDVGAIGGTTATEASLAEMQASMDQVVASSEAIQTSMDETAGAVDDAKASMGELAGATDGVVAGVDTAKASVAELAGTIDEAKASMGGMAATAGIEGAATGESLRAGVATGSAGIEEDLGAAGLAGGAALRGGVRDGTEDLESDMDDIGSRSGAALARGAEGGTSKVKGLLTNLGVPNGLLGGWAALGVAVGGVSIVALDLGKKMQSADAQIAVASGSTVKSAQSIGNAFLTTAGQSEFSALEMAQSFGQVAGQLKSVQGSALSTGQAMSVMKSAGDLATATSTNLSTATSALANVMQTFSVNSKGAANTANILLTTSEATGQGVSQLAQGIDRARTRIGALSPPLNQLSGLLVDMTDHGETGRQAMSALTTTFTTLLKPTQDQIKAQTDLKATLQDLPASLQPLAKEYLNGTINATQLTTATGALSGTQGALWSKFKSAADAMTTANQTGQEMGVTLIDNQGKTNSLANVIGQLHAQIAGLTPAQGAAKLAADGFGSSASKLLSVVEAGPAAYDKDVAAVSKAGAAHTAAAKQADTFNVELKTLKSAAEDWEIDLSHALIPALSGVVSVIKDTLVPILQILVPVIEKVVGIFISAGEYITKHKDLLIALAGVIGAILIPQMIALAESAGDSLVKGIGSALTSVETFGKSLVSSWGKLLGGESAWSQYATSAEAASGATAQAGEEIAASVTESTNATLESGAEIAQANDQWINSNQMVQRNLFTLQDISTETHQEIANNVIQATDQIKIANDQLIGSNQQVALSAQETADRMEVASEQMSASSAAGAAGVRAGAEETGLALDGAAEDAAVASEGIGASLGGLAGPIGILATVAVPLLAGALSHLFGGNTPTLASETAGDITKLNQQLGNMNTQSVQQLGNDIQTLTTNLTNAIGAQQKFISSGNTSQVQQHTAAINANSDAIRKAGKDSDWAQAQATLLSQAFGTSTQNIQAAMKFLGQTLNKPLSVNAINEIPAALTALGDKFKNFGGSAQNLVTMSAQAVNQANAQWKNFPDKTAAADNMRELETTLASGSQKALAAFLSNVQGGAAGVTAAEKSLGQDIPQSELASMVPYFAKQGNQAGMQLAVGVLAQSGQLKSALKSVGVDIPNSQLSQLQTLFGTNGKKAMDALNKSFTQKSNLQVTLYDLAATIATSITPKSNQINQVSETTIHTINDAFENHRSELSNIGVNMGQGVVSGLQKTTEALSAELSKEATSAISTAAKAIGAHSPSKMTEDMIGTPMMQGIALGITEHADDVSKALSSSLVNTVSDTGEQMKELFDKIGADDLLALEGQVNDFRDRWTSAWASIVSITSSAGATIIGFTQSIYSSGLDNLRSAVTQLSGVWTSAWNLVRNAVSNADNSMRSEFSDIVNELDSLHTAADSLEGAWSGVWANLESSTAIAGTNIGRSLAQGVEKGLNSSTSAVTAAANQIVNDAVNAAKSAGKISSPSQRFADEVGTPIAQGVAQGILAGSSTAVNAIRQLMNETRAGATGGVTGGSLGVSIAGSALGALSAGTGGSSAPTIINLTIPNNLQVNGQTLAQIVTQYQLRSARSTGNIAGRFAGGSQTGSATGINTNAIAR